MVAGSFLYQGIQGLMGHRNDAANAAPPPASREGLLSSDEAADALDEDTASLDGGDFDSDTSV